MIKKPQKRFSKISLVYRFYLRFLALICLGLSIFYWVRLVGIFPGILWRFDLMPWQWQFLSATLAIIYPIALIGIWMYSLWGIVLWCSAAFTETLVITSLYSTSNYKIIVPLLHGSLFLILIILQIFKRNHLTNLDQ